MLGIGPQHGAPSTSDCPSGTTPAYPGAFEAFKLAFTSSTGGTINPICNLENLADGTTGIGTLVYRMPSPGTLDFISEQGSTYNGHAYLQRLGGVTLGFLLDGKPSPSPSSSPYGTYRMIISR